MKYEDNEFDGLLNEALREVRQAEPRMGIEGRVLAGVRGKQRGWNVGWWKWAAGVAIAAMVLVAILVSRPKGKSVQVVVEKQPAQTIAPESPKKTAEAAKVPNRRVVAARHSTKNPASGKAREAVAVVSPPPPMTTQERALMAMAQSAPELFPKASREAESLRLSPIPEIKIAPLQGAENGGER